MKTQATPVAPTRPADEPLESPDRGLHALFSPAPADWALQSGYEAALEHEVESRFTVSNGLLASRASLEHRQRSSRPRSFVAGFFGEGDAAGRSRRLLPGPDWSRLELALDGEPVVVGADEAATFTRSLDLRRGILFTQWHQRGPAGRVVYLRTARLASRARRSLALQVAELRSSAAATIELAAPVDLRPDALASERDGVTTIASPDGRHRLAFADDGELRAGAAGIAGARAGRRAWRHAAAAGEAVAFTRWLAVARDEAIGPAGAGVRAELAAARRAGLEQLVAEHVAAWDERWRACEVVVDGDAEAQRALRFALYHLVSAADPGDERVSIGARALTGDGYLGHVFWDTEIFLLPFYVHTWPAAARALLMYRHHTLPGARAKAARLGYRGAFYAWESADTGDDVTPRFARRECGRVVPIRAGTDELHISADVAHAVWQYWEATRDREFLLTAGAEILLETARFWASRAAPEADGRYHLRGVIGPDEYHEDVDDNAYTNCMARRNLDRAREVARLLAERWPDRWAPLRERLRLTAAELALWDDVARRMAAPQHPQDGLLEQFAGFFELQDVDLAAHAGREAAMDVVLGRDRVQASQVSKQADVVMLLALQWDSFTPAARLRNFRYYEPRCGHGSSLSPSIHALVAARLGQTELALRYFRETAAIDLLDSMGNASGGVHIGAQGGLWQAVVFGFAGLGFAGDDVVLDPHLPAEWARLAFPLQWRGARFAVSITREPLAAVIEHVAGEAVTIRLGEARGRLARGQRLTFTRRDGAWQEASS